MSVPRGVPRRERRWSVCGLLSLPLAAASTAAAQQNLGFEAVDSAPRPAHWEILRVEDAARDLDVAVDAATAAEGQRSLRIRQSADTDLVRVAQRLRLSPSTQTEKAARRVRLTAAVLGSESPRAGPAIWLRVSGAKGSIFVDSRGDAREPSLADTPGSATPHAPERGVSGAAEQRAWRRYVLELPLPDDANELVFGAALRGQGAAWFDDFRIDVVAAQGLPASPAAVRYIDAALDIVQEHALNRSRVDWARVRSATLEHARGARQPADTYGALRFALRELGDQHSYLLAPSSAAALLAEPVSNARTGRAAVEPRAEMVAGRFGYLSVPGFAGGAPSDQARFAEGLQSLIRDIDKSARCGWILDLRTNSGGNLWPMLAGVGPLLGEGELAASVYPDGTTRPIWYRAGQAGFGDYVQLRVVTPYRLAEDEVPVAVLLGPRTASSAEVLATALRGRSHTRSFGAPTSGVSAGNRTFELADRAALVLTVAATADRTGSVVVGPIVPDEQVTQVSASAALSQFAAPDVASAGAALSQSAAPDPVLAAAMSWLDAEGQCH